MNANAGSGGGCGRYLCAILGREDCPSTQSGVIVETVQRTHSKKIPLVKQGFTDASIGISIFGHVAESGMTPVRPNGSRGA
jgi:hypothetical protein